MPVSYDRICIHCMRTKPDRTEDSHTRITDYPGIEVVQKGSGLADKDYTFSLKATAATEIAIWGYTGEVVERQNTTAQNGEQSHMMIMPEDAIIYCKEADGRSAAGEGGEYSFSCTASVLASRDGTELGGNGNAVKTTCMVKAKELHSWIYFQNVDEE